MKNNNTPTGANVTNIKQSNKAGIAAIIPPDLNQPLDIYNSPHPKMNKEGSVIGMLCHIENVKWLFSEYGIVTRYNVISKTQDLIIPQLKACLSDGELGQKIEVVRSLCEINKIPSNRIDEQIAAIANSNPYNPVIEYFQSKEWDEKSRIPELLDTVIVEESDLKWRDAAVLKFLIAACCLALNNEIYKFSVKATLVFQGDQGIGKTPWVKILTRGVGDYFKDGVTLNPDNKDSIILPLKNWIAELGELDATTKKADVAATKAFLTKYEDVIRLPYGKHAAHWVRRTAFIGTVNPTSFLVDGTGNDRYWSLAVKDLNLNALEKIDMQQLWAEIYSICIQSLKNNVMQPWSLTGEEKELQNQSNENFRLLLPIEESITDIFTPKIKEPYLWQASLLDICHIAGFEKSRLSPKDKAAARTLIEKLFGLQSKFYGKRGWAIPHPRGFNQSFLLGQGLLRRMPQIIIEDEYNT